MSILKMLREKAEPLTVAKLAGLLRVAEDTVQRWVRQRQIPSVRIGNVIRFDGETLADWVELQGACTHPIIRPFLQPRVPGDPDDYQMRWTDLGELASKDTRNGAAPEKPEKIEPQ
jgi:excisionase family DNA binding protein